MYEIPICGGHWGNEQIVEEIGSMAHDGFLIIKTIAMIIFEKNYLVFPFSVGGTYMKKFSVDIFIV